MYKLLGWSSHYDAGIKLRYQHRFQEMEQEFIKGISNNEYQVIPELFHYYLYIDTQKATLICDLAWESKKINYEIKSKIIYNMCVKLFLEIKRLDDTENNISDNIIVGDSGNNNSGNNNSGINIYEKLENNSRERKYEDLIKIIPPHNIPFHYLLHKKWVLFHGLKDDPKDIIKYEYTINNYKYRYIDNPDPTGSIINNSDDLDNIRVLKKNKMDQMIKYTKYDISSNYNQIFDLWGTFYLQSKDDPISAKKWYLKYFELNSSDLQCLFNMARCCVEEDKYSEMVIYLDQIISSFRNGTDHQRAIFKSALQMEINYYQYVCYPTDKLIDILLMGRQYDIESSLFDLCRYYKLYKKNDELYKKYVSMGLEKGNIDIFNFAIQNLKKKNKIQIKNMVNTIISNIYIENIPFDDAVEFLKTIIKNELSINILDCEINIRKRKRNQKCDICCTEKTNYTRLPCGHDNMCTPCFLNVISNLDEDEPQIKCPFCRHVVLEE